MRRGGAALSIAVASVVLGACASTPPERASRTDSSTERVCIDRRQINSLGALENDDHAFANVSTDRYYLLSVQKGCLALRFVQGIAIADNARRVCGDGFSFLTYVHPEFGPQRCRVVRIDSVENKKAAIELIEKRESDEKKGKSP